MLGQNHQTFSNNPQSCTTVPEMIQHLQSSTSLPLSNYEMIQKIDREIEKLQTQEGQSSLEAIGVNPHKFQRLLKATRSNLLGSCEDL